MRLGQSILWTGASIAAAANSLYANPRANDAATANNNAVATRPAASAPAAQRVIKTKYDHNEFQSALKAAAETGRPLVIKVGASWCGPCQNMAKTTLADAKVKKALDEAIYLRVEVDAEGESSAQRAVALDWAKKLFAATTYPGSPGRGFPTTILATVRYAKADPNQPNAEPKLELVVGRAITGDKGARAFLDFLNGKGGIKELREVMRSRGFGPKVSPSNER